MAIRVLAIGRVPEGVRVGAAGADGAFGGVGAVAAFGAFGDTDGIEGARRAELSIVRYRPIILREGEPPLLAVFSMSRSTTR